MNSNKLIKTYKTPVNYYKNYIHLYNTCKKVLCYSEDDEVLKNMCYELYNEDITNYSEWKLVNGYGICSMFYYKLKENLIKIKNSELELTDVLDIAYKEFQEGLITKIKTSNKDLDDPRIKESVAELSRLDGVYGIYFLYSEEGNLGYIGRSYNLLQRIPTSLSSRELYNFKYAITETMSDANIYEAYYIAKLKPFLNGDLVTGDDTTLELPELKFSKMFYYK